MAPFYRGRYGVPMIKLEFTWCKIDNDVILLFGSRFHQTFEHFLQKDVVISPVRRVIAHTMKKHNTVRG